MVKPLVIRDEIHGDMSFPPSLKPILDHPAFQRLRFIKQLGLADFIFPCANHTRFQHSLGAAFLAGQYFDKMTHFWSETPLKFEGDNSGTEFLTQQTEDTVKWVCDHPQSFSFWRKVVVLAGLLHDIGHGPFSHTFENLDIEQDFYDETAQTQGTLHRYFTSQLKRGHKLLHEDLSVLYLHQILSSENAAYLLPVATLIHKKLTYGEFRKSLEQELESHLKKIGIQGGCHFHRLLRPLISGPFDVDRIDYIQRDGRNCGVRIGAIEWRRIINRLVPCLAQYKGPPHEPDDVVLISSIKNQHVLDDFIFSLFQMYTQVYLHPKVVGAEEILRQSLKGPSSRSKNLKVNLATHQSWTDEKLRSIIREDLDFPQIDDILMRVGAGSFDVHYHPKDKKLDAAFKRQGFSLIEGLDRPMMKESIGVFLVGRFKDNQNAKMHYYFVRPWLAISPVAQHFYNINYSPNFWFRKSP